MKRNLTTSRSICCQSMSAASSGLSFKQACPVSKRAHANSEQGAKVGGLSYEMIEVDVATQTLVVGDEGLDALGDAGQRDEIRGVEPPENEVEKLGRKFDELRHLAGARSGTRGVLHLALCCRRRESWCRAGQLCG